MYLHKAYIFNVLSLCDVFQSHLMKKKNDIYIIYDTLRRGV